MSLVLSLVLVIVLIQLTVAVFCSRRSSQPRDLNLCLLSFLHWKTDCLLLEHGRGFPSSSAGKESACNAGDPWFNFWVKKNPWRRDRLPNPVLLGFPGGSDGKESACNVGDLGLTPGLGWEDPLEKGMATHSSILAWRIPMD